MPMVVPAAWPCPAGVPASARACGGPLRAVRAAVPFRLRAPDALVGLPRGTVRLLGNGRAASALTLYGRGLGQVVVWQEPASAPDTLAGDTALLPRVAIDGAANAALLAAQILALDDPDLRERLARYRQRQRQQVEAADRQLQGELRGGAR